MLRKLGWLLLAAVVVLLSSLEFQPRASSGQPATARGQQAVRPPSSPLPIAQVMLFSSGVGYFQRQGEVEGNKQIELLFPGTDINDLLKSMVLQDADGGTISTITYDSPDPVEKTLKSFALDLTYNPTFGQILNQARGEPVEVVVRQATLSGTIVGMESHPGGANQPEVEMLNLLVADGMHGINLADIQRIRFLNLVLENEFKRALGVLAGSHDAEKKQVVLGFQGDGKRRVRVGYVVENPIWKTSYRLVLKDKDRAFLQGWAVVENTSDEDWKDVRMALVSGRPISYQMNLYEPLFVPRPSVEPELFASLRPPVYTGALASGGQMSQLGGLGLGGLGLAGGMAGAQGGFGGGLGFGGGGQVNLGAGGGQVGNLGIAGFNRYQFGGGLAGSGGGGLGGFGQPPRPPTNPVGGQGAGDNEEDAGPARRGKLTYDGFLRRRQQRQEAKDEARKAGSALAAIDPNEGVASLAAAEQIGDRFQYVINQKVSLPRQKSVLLPVVNADVEARRVSIFQQSVDPRHPVLGLRFKNTSGHPLVQGPITIYERGNYAGDARILDLQANEERLIGYAVDLGTEVKAEQKAHPQQLVAAKIAKGTIWITNRQRRTRTYLVTNRSQDGRTLLIEHPISPDWKLVQPDRPLERSRDDYRFQLAVAAKQMARLDVSEEMSREEMVGVGSADDRQVRLLLTSTVVSPALKAALHKAADLKGAAEAAAEEVRNRRRELTDLVNDQGRLRENLKAVPKDSAAYKRYLDKFDAQETQVEKLNENIKQLWQRAHQEQKTYENYVAGLTVE
jgi:hypothetical protein